MTWGEVMRDMERRKCERRRPMQPSNAEVGQLLSAVMLVHHNNGELRAIKRWAVVEEVHVDHIVVNFEDGGGLVTLGPAVLTAFRIEP